VKQAFSILELLVVIAIMGILTSLLLPVFGAARDASQDAVCRNNQRQLVIAASAFRTDHESNPPAISYVQQDGVTAMVAWDDNEILWQYIDQDAHQMMCPNHIITTGSITGYNYNTSFIGDEDYLFTEVVHGVRPSDCAHPAHCAMFGDSSQNKFMRSPLSDAVYDPYTDDYTRCAGRQAYRHRGATNVAMLDGHVKIVKLKFNGCGDASSAGFISEDNAAYDPRVIKLH
jgi:prepilin-type N-terminal cleavage/methylation domain-containing protein/prepilin-type processing-associated H-X9-DG protein